MLPRPTSFATLLAAAILLGCGGDASRATADSLVASGAVRPLAAPTRDVERRAAAARSSPTKPRRGKLGTP